MFNAKNFFKTINAKIRKETSPAIFNYGAQKTDNESNNSLEFGYVPEGFISRLKILTSNLNPNNKYQKIVTNAKHIKGSDYSDEVFSSYKDETFSLKKGDDVIRFEPMKEPYFLPYKFGKDTVNLVSGEKLTLDLDNIGGKLSYARKGNDCIITARHRIELLGRGNGKEEWFVTKVKGGYSVQKTKYYFTGSGYASDGDVSESVMSKSEFKSFQKENGVKLKVGNNTLYTSWAVIPNPEIHYSKNDTANWGVFLGSITLKNYFKINEDNVYIGDTSLRDILSNIEDFNILDYSKSKSAIHINDSYMNEIIIGTKYSDKIISNFGDDEITGGKRNDCLTLGAGNKTVYINKGDGKDVITVKADNTSTNIVFDDEIDGITFKKSKNNLVIKREYGNKTESTIIKNYYKNNLDSNIMISSGDSVIFDKLDKDIANMGWEITCKYPPVDDIQPEIPQVVKPPTEPEEHWEIICKYPPADDISIVDVDYNALNQSVAAWQNNSSDVVDYVEQIQHVDILPVLVQG